MSQRRLSWKSLVYVFVRKWHQQKWHQNAESGTKTQKHVWHQDAEVAPTEISLGPNVCSSISSSNDNFNAKLHGMFSSKQHNSVIAGIRLPVPRGQQRQEKSAPRLFDNGIQAHNKRQKATESSDSGEQIQQFSAPNPRTAAHVNSRALRNKSFTV